MADNTFNGYTNYQTWAVAIVLDNDYVTHNRWISESIRAHSIDALEKRLKSSFENAMPELDMPFGDLLQSAFDLVNWRELATEYFDEYHEDEDDDDAKTEDSKVLRVNLDNKIIIPLHMDKGDTND